MISKLDLSGAQNFSLFKLVGFNRLLPTFIPENNVLIENMSRHAPSIEDAGYTFWQGSQEELALERAKRKREQTSGTRRRRARREHPQQSGGQSGRSQPREPRAAAADDADDEHLESDSAVSEESLKSSDNVCKIDMDHARLVAVEADSMSGDGAGSDHGSESRDLYTPTSPAESDHGGCGGYDGGDDGGDNGGCGGLTPSGDRFALPPAVLEDDQWSLISLNSDQRRDIDEMSSADLSESGHTAKTESVHSEAFSDEQAPPSKKARDDFKWKRPSGEDRDPRLRMMFGSFRLKNLIKSGSLAGMLCECSRHLDEGDSNTCARSIMVGKMELSDEDMIRALKRWAVWGLQFDAEPMCKTKHYKMAPRSFLYKELGQDLKARIAPKLADVDLNAGDLDDL